MWLPISVVPVIAEIQPTVVKERPIPIHVGHLALEPNPMILGLPILPPNVPELLSPRLAIVETPEPLPEPCLLFPENAETLLASFGK